MGAKRQLELAQDGLLFRVVGCLGRAQRLLLVREVRGGGVQSRFNRQRLLALLIREGLVLRGQAVHRG